MDYEKEYKDALDRAKAGKPIDDVFPELKESEDERIRNEIITFIEQAIHSGGGTIIPEEKEDKLLSYLEKQKEQKSSSGDSEKPNDYAGWSEEDERFVCNLIRYFKCDEALRYSEEETISWLKSLRPQTHWKPSEQEKGALQTAIHILTEERNFPKAAGHLQAILNAFEDKESRKDWKPSEEQIGALERAIIKMHTHNDIGILAELRDNLKKL